MILYSFVIIIPLFLLLTFVIRALCVTFVTFVVFYFEDVKTAILEEMFSQIEKMLNYSPIHGALPYPAFAKMDN